MILSYVYINSENVEREDKRRIQKSASRALLDETLCRLSIVERDVEQDNYGRPFIASRGDVDFNLSHSGDMVVCALSVGEGRVGVDVEKNDISLPERHREHFAKRYFSPSEGVDASNVVRAWTEKEAYLKYLGVGLTVDLKSVCPRDDENIRLEHLRIGEYFVTVCLGKDVPLEVIRPVTQETESPTEEE